MGALRAALVAVALLAAAPAAASAIDRWRPLIAEASGRFGIPQDWIARVMRAESAGQTKRNGRPIISHAGAMGLMQVMPATYAALARKHGFGTDPHQPRDNILAGTAYLRAMYDRYGYPGLFAAYNAGPGRYEEYLRGRRGLPGETRAYLAQLTGGAAKGTAVAAAKAVSPVQGAVEEPQERLFFVQRQPSQTSLTQPVREAPGAIFVPLNAAPGDDERGS